jgi:hypothetical protein
MSILFDTAPGLTERALRELLARAHGIDTVRVRVAVPEERRFTTAASLGVDPLNAPAGEAWFFDTPDLALHHAGVVVQGRRIADQRPSLSVALRPVVPHELAPEVCLSPRFRLDVEALPGFYVCSGTLRGTTDERALDAAIAGRRPIARVLSGKQRSLLAERAPAVDPGDLRALGPLDLLRLKVRPDGAPRRLGIEIWTYPDRSRVVVVSARAKRANALAMVGELRSYLVDRGIGLSAVQQTKVRAAALAHLNGDDV